MRIALAQISCNAADISTNLEKISLFAEKAKHGGADLVCFPELSDVGYDLSKIPGILSSWENPSISALQKISRQHGLTVVAGLLEKVKGSSYNSAFAFDSSGRQIAHYRKTHLFPSPPGSEEEIFTPGSSRSIFKVQDFIFNLAICFDLRFPEHFRATQTTPIDVHLIVSAWPQTRIDHWNKLLPARAIENIAYCIAVNRVGADGSASFGGNSCVYDPFGQLQNEIDQSERLIFAEISKDTVESTRINYPFIARNV